MLKADIGWGMGTTITTAPLGGFTAEGVFLGTIQVPAGATPGPNTGAVTVAEYQGPPTSRVVTLSTLPCDFRGLSTGFPTDPTGANNPIAWASGGTASAYFAVGAAIGKIPGLVPGKTYYVNVRNYSVDLMALSCVAMTKCDAIVALNPPQN